LNCLSDDDKKMIARRWTSGGDVYVSRGVGMFVPLIGDKASLLNFVKERVPAEKIHLSMMNGKSYLLLDTGIFWNLIDDLSS
jgi:hypothetical protein